MSNATAAVHSCFSTEELIGLLQHMVNIPSHQDYPGQERDLAAWLQQVLVKEGIAVVLQDVADGRTNLLATLPGIGQGQTLLLNGHLDTVPPYQMTDPFQLTEEGGRLYGRGAVDMKGALAAMVGTMISVKRSGTVLDGDLCFAATIGEESYSPGAYHLVEQGISADYAIVGEPTMMQIAIAHKGVTWLEVEFFGKASHGSVPEAGINAIYHASAFLERLQKDYIPNLKQRSHPILGSPTISVGMIEGGTRPVIVAERCVLRIDRRLIPGETADTAIADLRDLLEGLEQDVPGFKAEVREMPVFHGVPHPPMSCNPDNRLVVELQDVIQELKGTSAETYGAQFWTDGALFNSIGGIPTVVLGPGNIEQAHANDEYIETEQLIMAHRVYTEIAMRLCRNEG